MAVEKQGYQLKANANSVEIAVGTGLIRLEGDAVYETADPDEIRELDGHPMVKAADAKPSNAKAGKG